MAALSIVTACTAAPADTTSAEAATCEAVHEVWETYQDKLRETGGGLFRTNAVLERALDLVEAYPLCFTSEERKLTAELFVLSVREP